MLKLAHEHVLSGHLGVTKTFRRVSRYFYWPGLKLDVSNFCRSCPVCQLAGKPNKNIPVAPLQPIPVMREPFERLLVDCVGPVPKSKSGHEHILTIMCTATRFPEAIPLRSIRAQMIIKELVKFCTTFGLPRVVQTDQGSNFTSKAFTQTLAELGVKHQLSSAYHPESQGALERFHQTLKSMLRSYCIAHGKDWAEGLPYLMFAVREAEQESLGFSSADLVFGHTVRGPLKLLSEQLLAKDSLPVTVLDYVSTVRERLYKACELAREHLITAQSRMKTRYDKRSVNRSFQSGDSVLILLPESGSVFRAKFSGPYEVKEKLSDTNYVIYTPDRCRKTRVCHINMLKQFIVRGEKPISSSVSPVVVATVSEMPEDEPVEKVAQVAAKKLQNSAILSDFQSFLAHLTTKQSEQIIKLVHEFPSIG